MSNKKLSILLIRILIVVFTGLMISSAYADSEKSNRIPSGQEAISDTSKAPEPEKKSSLDGWYFKPSFYVNYYNIGTELNDELAAIGNLFSAYPVQLKVLQYSPIIKMNSSSKIERMPTNFIPSGNIGFGLVRGRHKFEFDIGIAGLVTLNTIDEKTRMTLTEMPSSDPDDHVMQDLEFVNSDGVGTYSLDVKMNEDQWIITPAFSYEYEAMKKPWGDLSVGGSLGLVIMTLSQNIEFKAKRLDIDTSDPYSDRVLEGKVMSSAANDFGPIIRLFVTLKRKVMGKYKTDFRFGFNYGFVNVERDVDGYGILLLGGQAMPTSFAVDKLSVDGESFKNKEKNTFELNGVFFQVGIPFDFNK